jgi:DNA-binding XRE family transcriptional regulator
MKKLIATEKLRETREQLELTMDEMASVFTLLLEKNFALSTYQKIEEGERSIKLTDAIQISRHFHIPIKELWRIR